MKIKKRGIIGVHNLEDFGIDRLLIPSIFVGRTFKEGAIADAEKRIGLSHLKDGQFVFEHQFAGHVCDCRVLAGIFLPLSSCDSPEIRARLHRVAEEFRPRDPFFAKMKRGRWQQFLLETGPLKSRDEDFEEAFIRFEAGEAYPWIKAYFKFIAEFAGLGNDDVQKRVTEISDLERVDLQNVADHKWRPNPSDASLEAFHKISEESRESRKIGELRKMPWGNLEDFSKWLSPDENHPITTNDVAAALVYENSD